MNQSTVVIGILSAVVWVAGGAATVYGDWNPGDPDKMHYPQLPDLTATGLDVLASVQPSGPSWKILADDWQCNDTGPVTDIHIWGSWLNDQLDPAPTFKLSIHDNVVGPPSQPGNPLWQALFSPGAYTSRLYAAAPEQFYDPNLNEIIGVDTQIWQYNFTDLPNPFMQVEGTIYWLDVQVLSLPATYFGWKTTNPSITPHFMDDAVFADTDGFFGPLLTGWGPMIYPLGHPYEGLSIDLAFVITTIPEPVGMSWLAVIGLLMLRRKT